MPRPRLRLRRGPRLGAGLSAAGLALAVLLVVAPVPGARATPYPPLPIALDRQFLGNLSAPDLAPGASGTLRFALSNPLSVGLDAVVLALEIYAFNGFPGNASATVPVAGAPILVTPSSSGEAANVSVGALGTGGLYRGSVGVATSASTPDGAFAVRAALSFDLASNGTAYRLESRGWFNASTWAAATELPNGSATLNLSVLGVSGVLPETAVFVANTSTWEWLLGGLLAGAFVLVGLGAYVYFRRGPGSRSGSR